MLAPRSSRVVFAEDDATFRNAVLTVLRHWGIEVFACDDGAQAVELCEAIKPDAALFDLDMPSMDGFEAARRLRANPALLGMRIVALTGCGSLDYRMRAVDSCFDQFLCKPVSLRPLLEALHVTSHEARTTKSFSNNKSPAGSTRR